ncbi:MAG: hypothetical protein VX246_08090 [Myxococcota bacterium]|nr:hypothetical protein [Myxococcota bacterium]
MGRVNIIRMVGIVFGVVTAAAGAAWLMRTDPIGPVAGRALSGAEEAYPANWDFSEEAYTVAVETRPEDPHSVTTLAWVHEGSLHVPAMNGTNKKWTQIVLDDSRVRIKVGDRVFPAKLVRVALTDPEPFLDSAAVKYSQIAENREDGELPEDIWMFRVEPR